MTITKTVFINKFLDIRTNKQIKVRIGNTIYDIKNPIDYKPEFEDRFYIYEVRQSLKERLIEILSS